LKTGKNTKNSGGKRQGECREKRALNGGRHLRKSDESPQVKGTQAKRIQRSFHEGGGESLGSKRGVLLNEENIPEDPTIGLLNGIREEE